MLSVLDILTKNTLSNKKNIKEVVDWPASQAAKQPASQRKHSIINPPSTSLTFNVFGKRCVLNRIMQCME